MRSCQSGGALGRSNSNTDADSDSTAPSHWIVLFKTNFEADADGSKALFANHIYIIHRNPRLMTIHSGRRLITMMAETPFKRGGYG